MTTLQRPVLRSQRLNQITHEPHSKLDALVKAHAPFETQANFARFVVAQYLFQAELAAHVRVPVATSALIQVPWVQALLPPGQRVGIITVSAQSLTPRHLAAAGVPTDTPIAGTEEGREFFRVLVRGEKQEMDIALAATDILDAGSALISRYPDIGAIVLECTNMPPYAFALHETLRLPVFYIYSLITWFHAGLRPREFGFPADRSACLGQGISS